MFGATSIQPESFKKQTPEEVEETRKWIEQRRKNFPTKKRIEGKEKGVGEKEDKGAMDKA